MTEAATVDAAAACRAPGRPRAATLEAHHAEARITETVRHRTNRSQALEMIDEAALPHGQPGDPGERRRIAVR